MNLVNNPGRTENHLARRKNKIFVMNGLTEDNFSRQFAWLEEMLLLIL